MKQFDISGKLAELTSSVESNHKKANALNAILNVARQIVNQTVDELDLHSLIADMDNELAKITGYYVR